MVSVSSQAHNKVRYFILKSINSENIQRAVSEGIWATQVHNEVKLNEAFRGSERVVLIFSVNASGHFQGYAKMTTLVGGMRGRPSSWLGNASVGSIFGIEWQRVVDLEFSATAPLGNNPLNENKPVRIARDGQELPTELGASMVALFEETAKRNGCAKPVPPPRPPPQPRPPTQGGAGGMPPGIGTRPVAGAMVFNEMGQPMGPLGSFGMGVMNGGGYGMGGPGHMMGMQPGMSMGMGMNGMGMGGMMGMMGRGMPPMGAHGMMQGSGGMGGPMGSLPMPALNMGMGQNAGLMGQNMGMSQNHMGMNGGSSGYGGGGGMLQGGHGGLSGTGGNLGSGMDRVWRDPGLLLPSRRRSPEYKDRGRSRSRRSRSRSRSYSRRRHRSSRRSRSRSSSRGRSRAGTSAAADSNVLDMTYEDYLEQFERMRQQKATAASQVGHPQQQQEGPMNGAVGHGGGSSMAQQNGGAPNGGDAGGGRPVLMSEQAYIQHCRQLAHQNGTPFDIQAVQQFYRQMAAQMNG